MVTFAGIDHAALTVTDLDVSQAFYADVLGFTPLVDVGYGRLCMHPETGFALALLKPDGGDGGEFTELTTGLDHLGLYAASREELEEWQRRFDELGVSYSPIRDMELASHLNFRDPDGIALELIASNELGRLIAEELRSGPTREEIDARVAELFGPEMVIKH